MCEACPILDWAEALPTVASFTSRKVTDTMNDFIIWFDRYDHEQKPLVGGKNSSLGEMMMAELPVPPGFAITIDAYQLLWFDRALVDEVNGLLRNIDHDNAVANRVTADRIRAAIEAAPMPEIVAEEVTTAYDELCEHCDTADVPVAVRSSATAEDQPDASFAGQQDTYLWVRGTDDLLTSVQRCWSSLFTDRAIAYRHQMGYLHQGISMSVGVQKMVDPKASGVAFTLNPTNGDRSQVAIDASWGLGEAVVSGEVTPDNFLVDKVIHEIVLREISDKHIEYRLGDDGVVHKGDVEPERRKIACVTDDELKAIAVLARRAEKHYGTPQDVEWAIDRHLRSGSNVVMLQSRPETVWSQKKRDSVVSRHSDPMASIVSTLVAPLHTRET